MEKYYTPALDEFYPGFEYETIYLKSVWTKECLRFMDAGWFFESYINDAVETEFRVKYLDQEDIEECGFVKLKDKDYVFCKGSKNLFIQPNNTIKITSIFHNTLFEGTIKNKSELKKLLKQLNII